MSDCKFSRLSLLGVLLFIFGMLVIPSSGWAQLKDETVVSGLKEALSEGTATAVSLVSQTDGFFKNDLIKIRLPNNMQRVADTLGKIGLQQQVDDFILSMNRAAEAAAPKAAAIFGDAIKTMDVRDALGILNGGDTAATDYFRENTSDLIYTEFQPVVSDSMREVGTRGLFDSLMQRYNAIPFASSLGTFDLDDYVTQSAIAGLFQMVAQEEEKIRQNPAARTTDLLKSVFSF